jgi:TonB family protein
LDWLTQTLLTETLRASEMFRASPRHSRWTLRTWNGINSTGAPNFMTARYAPAAFLATLLHAAVIVVLVLFALATRNEPDVALKLSGRIFDVVNPSTTPAQVPERGVHVVIPPMPKVVVREEPEAPAPVVKNERPVVQPPPPAKSNTSRTQAVAAPPQKVTSSVKPSRTASPVASVRVDTHWGDPSSGKPRSDIPSVDATAPQATSELEAYMAELRARLKAALQVAGMRPNLVAEVEFVLRADGLLVQPRIITSSGSAEFDRAVVQAINRTQMRPRPDGKTVTLKFPFATELK